MSAGDRTPPIRTGRLAALVVLFLAVTLLVPRPETVTPQGWRTFGIFVCVIAGMAVQPMPGAALVVIGLTAMTANGIPMREALGGFGEPSVWLVLAAMLMARAILDSGLARRLALLFIRRFGSSSLGIAYALVMTDITLATGVPSITARSAGMVLPIGRSIAELFGSTPGPTAPRLGRFLVSAMYQGSAVACAMFLTGQASNLLAAGLAAKLAGVEVTWSGWFMAAVVPGLVSCLVVPWVVLKMVPPEVTHTPEAAAFAGRELTKLGPIRRREGITMAVFIGVGLLWLTTGWHRLDVTMVALAGLSVMLVTSTLSWDSIVAERSAWDVFIWYGGLLKMGELLNATGVPTAFATGVGALLTGVGWFTVLVLVLLLFFVTHYLFASITAHMLALFPPFVTLLIGVGVPPKLAVYSLMCLANLPAGLTHYGTTTGPILFSQGYVTLSEWWRTGAVVGAVNLTIWVVVGLAWWRVLGFW
ncbi:MAG: DASS family sodium-coupled anion symporter [Acidobacteria bacterium]|nr:DASS family sodium-coupled anion symporter [Acidobacteriota bacterium]